MKKKVFITESQLKKVVKTINENNQMEIIVRQISNDLIMNYEPAIATYNDGVEFNNDFIVTKKVDGDKLSVGALKDYLTTKYPNVTETFIEQVIKDWYDGILNGKNYQLSKNIKFI